MAKERLTRGRPSKIEQLPEQVKCFLDAALRDNGTSQAEILAEVNKQLDTLGEDAISRSGLNRYATQMERIGKKMRETNAVADAWVSRLGNKPTGQVGNLLIQMTRSMAFDLALSAQEQENEDGEQEPPSLGMLKDLALTIQRLEKASMDSLKREKEIRKAFAEEAAKAAEKVATAAGLTREAVTIIKNDILGIA
ncbi:DUF3486 family protein [Oceanobacter sp. 4_MG-2023]|uniref:DUF3486 family protein n=1 Tax=Oceanobacter sp. 4_MG-2023 TaxID=3062623 RepID=UPI0027361C73|nr:DUF3486 family protein [Oceanobacter sp. 4_MG-2023]MDP2548073.1 DUF3486 family protein [Oceanobacter sp. 4_MG-2023]